MNIAFDLHGVLEKYPDKFKAILTTLRVDHRVIILSGSPTEDIYEELEGLRYQQGHHYDDVISVVDWLKDQGVEMFQHDDESYYCDSKIWWSSKAKICKERFIRMLFDDSIKYKEYITEDMDLLFIHIQ